MDELYTVIDLDTGRILEAGVTLTEAVRIRDALTTLGDPRIFAHNPADIEGAYADTVALATEREFETRTN